MPTPKGKPLPKRATPARLAKTPAIALTTQGQRTLQDNRRATDAELTAILKAAANDWNRALRNATKAGLVIMAEMKDPMATAEDELAKEGEFMRTLEPVSISTPQLVDLRHIGRTYL